VHNGEMNAEFLQQIHQCLMDFSRIQLGANCEDAQFGILKKMEYLELKIALGKMVEKIGTKRNNCQSPAILLAHI
jgi:hypothetical protein